MAKRATVLLVTGPARSGKTFRRCAYFLTQEYLPHESGRHISNFPIQMDALCQYMEKHHGMSADEVRRRVEVIPDDVLAGWRAGRTTPKDYFAGRDIDQCHIAIDEVHKYCGRLASKQVRKDWQEWLGEIGHSGGTVEVLSQAPEKIAREIEFESEKRLFISNLGEQRDPFFGVRRADWLELWAKVTRRGVKHMIAQEERQRDGTEWVTKDRMVLRLDPELFPVYDSFSAPDNGGVKSKGFASEADRRSLWSLVWYIVRMNSERLLPRLGVLVLGYWLFLGGGGGWLLRGGISHVVNATAKGGGLGSSKATPQPGGLPNSGTASGAFGAAATQPTTQPSEADTLRVALARERAERQALTERLSEVVALGPDFAVFSGGELVKVGETIGEGSYAGQVLQSVDMVHGVCAFSGGVRARLRRSGTPGSYFAGVAADSGSGSGGPSTQPARRDRAGSDDVGERADSGRLRTRALPANRDERGGATGLGRASGSR